MHKYVPGTTNMFPICLLILQVPWIAFEIGKQSSVSGAISQNMQSQFCLSAIREQWSFGCVLGWWFPLHPNCLPGYTQSLGSSPGINSFCFCTPVTEPLILDCLSGSQIDATRTPQLLYLDDGKHFWKGILGGGHRRQEAEEMVSRGIRKHLKVVGRVLWSTNRVSENPSSSRPCMISHMISAWSVTW